MSRLRTPGRIRRPGREIPDAPDDAGGSGRETAATVHARHPLWSTEQCESYAATLNAYADALDALPTRERMPQRTNRHPNTKHRKD